jgi:hypothetical protein
VGNTELFPVACKRQPTIRNYSRYQTGKPTVSVGVAMAMAVVAAVGENEERETEEEDERR